jgi:hypothetical protein
MREKALRPMRQSNGTALSRLLGTNEKRKPTATYKATRPCGD